MVKLVKETDGFIAKHINRKVSTKISVFLVRSKLNISPNGITFLSFLIATLGACLFLGNFPLFGGIMAQISSILDGCDGEIARLTNKMSKEGEILDSVLDRFADGLLIMSITILAYEKISSLMIGAHLIIALGFLALIGSFSVSYTAAKGLNIGYEYKRRWAGRDIRLFVIMLAGISAEIFPSSILLFLFILVVLTFSETICRIRETFKKI